MAKRVVVTGATGLIGQALCQELIAHGYEIVVFSRAPEAARAKVADAAAYVAWQPETTGGWAAQIDGAYGVVYLAGESIFSFGKRHTRADISAQSAARERGEQGIVAAMAAASVKPQVFVGASSVGAYGYAGFTDADFDESSPHGDDFWGRDSATLETATLAAEDLGVRTVVIRTGYVLDAGPHGGLQGQAEQFRRGFGGPVLPGRQWLPWIHLADAVGLFALALEDERARGPLNAVAPGLVRQTEFAATLGRVVGKPSWVPVPGFALRLAVGVTADIVIHGRRVIPHRAQELGYAYRFPDLEGAMRDLLSA